MYLDNPAGTQVPFQVERAVVGYYREANANTHGSFLTSRRTDAIVEHARLLSAAFLGAESPSEVAFGPNTTTLTYALSRAFARVFRAGDEVIVSDLDHDANISPWLILQERGVVIRRVPIRPSDCSLDLSQLERLLSPRTRLVAVGYASNAIGTINDISRITALAHAVGAWVWVDAVHYAPHGPIDVQALDVDFLVCSAYKFFGPHLAIFWGKSALLAQLPVEQVRPAPQSAPEKFETGTKNHEGLAGLIGAFEYLAALGARAYASEPGMPTTPARSSSPGDLRRPLLAAMSAIRAHESKLGERLLEGLQSIPGLRLYGMSRAEDLRLRVPTFGFTLDGIANLELSQRLAERGIFTWAGNHYALTLMERLGIAETGMVRVGAVHYNTAEEVERLIVALEGIRREMR